MGANLNASIMENAIMTHHSLNAKFSRWRGLLLDYAHARAFLNGLEKAICGFHGFQIQPVFARFRAATSKVILGRELLLDSVFVLLDQPTPRVGRGLDRICPPAGAAHAR